MRANCTTRHNNESTQTEGLPSWTGPLAPSLYTAALLQVLHTCRLPQGRVCEIGVGSGICLGALAMRGFHDLWGSDVSPVCLQAARELLSTASQPIDLELRLGSLWDPFEGEGSFEVVLANLPHFPGNTNQTNRLPNWQGGNGRALMDQFLKGLPGFLSWQGAALITHHDLIGLAHTEKLLASLGLTCAELLRWTVYENPQRMAAVTDRSLLENCTSLRQIGPYCLIDSRILRVTHIQKCQ